MMSAREGRAGFTRRWLAAFMLLALLVGATALVGCSKKSGDGTTSAAGDTTTTGATNETTPITGLQRPTSTPSVTVNPDTVQNSTGTSIVQTIPVGGKTKEEYEKSLPDLEAKVKTNPNDLTTLQDLAIAQYQTERYADAITTYKQMLAIKDDPTTRNNMANVLRDSGKLSEATAEYQKAIAADPLLVVAYVNLATLQFNQGKGDAAYKTLDDGIAKTSGDDQKRLKAVKNQFQNPPTTTTT